MAAEAHRELACLGPTQRRSEPNLDHLGPGSQLRRLLSDVVHFFEVGAKGKTWRQQQRSEKKPISAMHFHWVTSADIYRPDKGAVEYDCVEGISSSYQYFMLRQGGVLIRNHSCWCRACFKVAMGGPGAGRATSGLDADYGVHECVHATEEFYEWSNKSCRCIRGGDAAGPDERARGRGEELASQGVIPGQWVLVESYADDDEEMWLGKTAACFGRNTEYTGSYSKIIPQLWPPRHMIDNVLGYAELVITR